MLQKKIIIKIIALVLTEIIILTLLLTGTLIFPSTKVKNLIEQKSLITSKVISQVVTSDNYIYVSYIYNNDFNFNFMNITKYDSNLKQVWSFLYNYNNIIHGGNGRIISATDQNVLLRFSKFTNISIQYYDLIVNNDGIQAKFNMTQLIHLPMIPSYLGSVLPLGSNYFVPFLTFNQNKTQINGLLLNKDNTTTTLFKSQNYNNIAPQEDAFYSNSYTIEIPFSVLKEDTSNGLGNYNITDSYFLEYNTISHTLIQKRSNYAIIANEVKNLQPTINDMILGIKYIPIYKNYYAFVPHKTPQGLKFEVWGNSGILSSYTVSGLYSESDYNHSPKNFNFYTSSIVPIENKVFIDTLYLANNRFVAESILLIFSHYSFHSNFEQFNYSNLFSGSNQSITGYTTNIGNNLVYYGLIYRTINDTKYFVKIIYFGSSIFDALYTTSLILKFLIGLIFIAPSVYFVIRKSNQTIINSETYPVD